MSPRIKELEMQIYNLKGELVEAGGLGDIFCPVWPLFELLEGGKGSWEPSH